MNLHPKNVQLRRSVDMAKRPPNDSKFFLVVVLILKIANLDAAAGFEDFCPQKYALVRTQCVLNLKTKFDQRFGILVI